MQEETQKWRKDFLDKSKLKDFFRVPYCRVIAPIFSRKIAEAKAL